MELNEKKQIIESYITMARPMPTLPEAVVRILRLSNSPDVEVEDIADAILMDKVLTADTRSHYLSWASSNSEYCAYDIAIQYISITKSIVQNFCHLGAWIGLCFDLPHHK